MSKKAVVIVSGGMDSTCLLWDTYRKTFGNFNEIRVLSVNYGQRHSCELECAAWQCKELGLEHAILDLSAIGPSILSSSALTNNSIDIPEGHYESSNAEITVVPNRNMILISLALGYVMSFMKEGDDGSVFYGAHAGDFAIYADCRKVFVDAMQKAAGTSSFLPVDLRAPYIDCYKWDIVDRAIYLGLEKKDKASDIPMKHTHTCYKGKRPACGKCPTCQERIISWYKNGAIDPLEYEMGWDKALEYALSVETQYQESKNNK